MQDGSTGKTLTKKVWKPEINLRSHIEVKEEPGGGAHL